MIQVLLMVVDVVRDRLGGRYAAIKASTVRGVPRLAEGRRGWRVLEGRSGTLSTVRDAPDSRGDGSCGGVLRRSVVEVWILSVSCRPPCGSRVTEVGGHRFSGPAAGELMLVAEVPVK